MPGFHARQPAFFHQPRPAPEATHAKDHGEGCPGQDNRRAQFTRKAQPDDVTRVIFQAAACCRIWRGFTHHESNRQGRENRKPSTGDKTRAPAGIFHQKGQGACGNHHAGIAQRLHNPAPKPEALCRHVLGGIGNGAHQHPRTTNAQDHLRHQHGPGAIGIGTQHCANRRNGKQAKRGGLHAPAVQRDTHGQHRKRKGCGEGAGQRGKPISGDAQITLQHISRNRRQGAHRIRKHMPHRQGDDGKRDQIHGMCAIINSGTSCRGLGYLWGQALPLRPA